MSRRTPSRWSMLSNLRIWSRARSSSARLIRPRAQSRRGCAYHAPKKMPMPTAGRQLAPEPPHGRALLLPRRSAFCIACVWIPRASIHSSRRFTVSDLPPPLTPVTITITERSDSASSRWASRSAARTRGASLKVGLLVDLLAQFRGFEHDALTSYRSVGPYPGERKPSADLDEFTLILHGDDPVTPGQPPAPQARRCAQSNEDHQCEADRARQRRPAHPSVAGRPVPPRAPVPCRPGRRIPGRSPG